MAFQILARKYRPKNFDEVVGQKHITETLKNAAKKNELHHGFLLSGTRGVGKTSVARVLAKALNCEKRLENGNPCCECVSCVSIDSGTSIDVQEIDGASNNNVDHIRKLIENVQFVPSERKYKVYIIDEVHMLTTSAFNALLKTLEEPPAHVKFIFATTEPEKLLDTVISRCMRFDFKHVDLNDLVLYLKHLAELENIVFDSDEILEKICIKGKGSLRDTLSTLDQVLSYTLDRKIDEEILLQSLGLVKAESVGMLINSIFCGDANKTKLVYNQLLKDNIPVKNILEGLQSGIFEIIENIDSLEKISHKYSLQKSEIATLSMPELFWIFEQLAKDAEWALASLSPEKVVLVVLLKISMRRQYFKKDTVENKKNIEIKNESAESANSTQLEKSEAPEQRSEVKQEIASPLVEQPQEPQEKVKITPKSWKECLKLITERAPALGANLEQGNLIGELETSLPNLDLKLAYSKSGKIFHDYLVRSEEQTRLKKILAEILNKPVENIIVNFKLIEEESTFVSSRDLDRKVEQSIKEQRIEKVLSDPVLREAEAIFGSKVDRNTIVLSDISNL